jgi:hypothetical protein
MEHKGTACKYRLKHMRSFSFGPAQKRKEWNIIHYIAKVNNFPYLLIRNINQYAVQKINYATHHKYTVANLRISEIHSPLKRKITNLFRHTNIGIAFRNTNAMYYILKPKIHVTQKEDAQSGIYELTCSTHKCSCVGQTGRYQKQVRRIKHNNPQST